MHIFFRPAGKRQILLNIPGDTVSENIWKAEKSSFELGKGPIFINFLLADEINRAMPKTQSALLEAMEERQVTIEGTNHRLDTSFEVMLFYWHFCARIW